MKYCYLNLNILKHGNAAAASAEITVFMRIYRRDKIDYDAQQNALRNFGQKTAE